MDILRQEQTEDILAFGGVSRDAEANEETYWQGKLVEGVRRRVGWLLFLFLAGFLTKYVSHFFKGVQLRLPDLVDFIPLMIGTGGNAGSQTVGTIIRGIALGEIQGSHAFRVLYREWLTGLLLGTLLGGLGFFYTWALARQPGLRGRHRPGDPVHLHVGQQRRRRHSAPGQAIRHRPRRRLRPLDQHAGRRHGTGDLLHRRHRALIKLGGAAS